MKKRTGHKLRLPVRVVDGVIEFEYGGRLPIRQDAYAELIVDKEDIEDPEFLDVVSERRIIKILPEGATLYAVLSSNGPISIPSEDIKLGKWFDERRFPSYPHFVPIKIGPLHRWQAAPDQRHEGGLWLEMEGNRSIQMVSSSIELPLVQVTDPIRSLNHAYTILSEHFEPHRISHTGNVYEQVLYQEANGYWYPLKLFRDGKIADEEHAIARAFWEDLKAQFKSTIKDG